MYWFNDAGCLLTWLNIPFLAPTVPAWRTYRSWTFEQLALATSFLLGPNEGILAAEVNLDTPGGAHVSYTRDIAVVVTARHVLIFGIDSFDGQPRWIALAARPSDVNMESRWTLKGGNAFGPALIVTKGTGRWVISRFFGVSKTDDVVEAWRQAAEAAAY